ncbi:aryl-sulfate sulfotransferase [Myxococcota bacterium]|nr:aryl-sulfate sulfotransferase [Myxococcota bacterium]
MHLSSLALAAGALGCQPGRPDAAFSELVPTVLTLRWTSTLRGRAHVELGQEELDVVTPATEGLGTEHAVVVYGLKAGEVYRARGVVTAEDGSVEHTAEVEVEVAPAPPELPRFTLARSDADLLPGYVLTSTLGADQSWVVILDADADPVWFLPADGGLSITSTRPSRDGQDILYSQYDTAQRTDLGGVLRVRLDGSDRLYTRTPLAHHDFAELPDGQLAWIALDIRPAVVEEEEVDVAGDQVMVGAEGGTGEDAQVAFSFWDFFEPWETCKHFDGDVYGTGAKDWSHANSLMYDEEQDAFYILSKNQDGLIKVDRQGGQRQWQANGRFATLETLGGRDWSHGHMSQRWSDGFMMFDNGYHNGSTSWVEEYALDEQAGTIEKVFQYQTAPGTFIELLGDARKLPDGSYLASWTSLGTIERLDGEGQLRWQAVAELGAAVGRVSFIEDLYTLDQP